MTNYKPEIGMTTCHECKGMQESDEQQCPECFGTGQVNMQLEDLKYINNEKDY